MAQPLVGMGYLLVSDILSDVSYALFQPVVNTSVPAPGIPVGTQTVAAWDESLYQGAQIVVGAAGSADIEVVVVAQIDEGVSFTATFANAHAAGEPITGPTFPVRQATDPFFTQSEMLAYISTAVGDFLLQVPMVYAVGSAAIPFSQQNGALPPDCMVPARIAVQTAAGNYPLRETSQAELDSYNFRWNQSALATQAAYFRDKLPTQTFGVWPRAGNNTLFEIVYQQRQAQLLGLADGFLFPDCFTVPIKHHVLSMAYSKDGEFRNNGLAKFHEQHYVFGCKGARMFLDALNDSGLEMG